MILSPFIFFSGGEKTYGPLRCDNIYSIIYAAFYIVFFRSDPGRFCSKNRPVADLQEYSDSA